MFKITSYICTVITSVVGLNTGFLVDSNKAFTHSSTLYKETIPILHHYCLIGISAFCRCWAFLYRNSNQKQETSLRLTVL